MIWKRAAFALLLLASLAMFAWTLRRFGRMVVAGKSENRFDKLPARLWSVLAYFLGQKKVAEQVQIPAQRASGLVTAIGSRYHLIIFWGFLVITVGTVEVLVQGLAPQLSWALLLGDAAATRVLYPIIDWSNLL